MDEVKSDLPADTRNVEPTKQLRCLEKVQVLVELTPVYTGSRGSSKLSRIIWKSAGVDLDAVDEVKDERWKMMEVEPSGARRRGNLKRFLFILFPSLRMAHPSSSLPTYFLLWSTLLPKLKACKISALRYSAAFLHGVGLQTDLCVDRHRGRHLHQIGRKLMS